MIKKRYLLRISSTVKSFLTNQLVESIRKMSHPNLPIGCKVLSWFHANCCPRLHINRLVLYKISILGLTYASYLCYHMTRKTLSVVKSVLHRNCSDLPVPNGVHDETWCDYPPFDGPDASTLLGTLDSAFLFSYGIAMFVSGFVAERVSLRYFLTLGMLFSGIFCYLFGMAKVYDIHSLMYFVIIQAFAGVFQTTGWPGVVTLVGRWFGKSKRGLIFGIWNSHTSIGNILGSVIAGYYVEKDWSLSFIVPGFIMGIVGFIIFLFVVEHPNIVGINVDAVPRTRRGSVETDDDAVSQASTYTDNEALIPGNQDVNVRITNERIPVNERSPILGRNRRIEPNQGAIGFMGALKIPGVVEFSLCLFFSKLVSYTFLFWLPLYIQSSTSMSARWSANLSTVFDFGGILGAILAGVVSDYSGMSALTCTSMLFVSAPLLFIYEKFGTTNIFINIFLLFVCGCFVNGPYALITTSVSAELGTHSSLQGNSKALATVTAIIDGTGSFGAAIGPLLAGLVSNTGWDNVFYMLILSDIIALFLLLRLVIKELDQLRRRNARIE